MDKMSRRNLVFLILFAGSFLTGGVEAATLEVGPSGYPFTSIQAAINASTTGDTVLVHDGTYVENITFSGKAISVTSATGAAGTIINGGGTSHVVTFDQGEGSGSVLDGFTITNGNGPYESWGGGIRCASSSPTITRCIITGNSSYAGGGICCQSSSSPTITDCTIRENTAFLGGGIFCWGGSSPIITNCRISGNTGSAHSGAIGCDTGCSPIITNCIINGNTAGDGGGIYSYLSSPTLINCTISGNTATSRGGAIRCQQGTASVKNSILWGNVPSEVYLDAGDTITFTSSNIDQDGYAGSGNIRRDPLFVDSGYGDFSLMSTSPCIDAATSEDAPSTDMKGNQRFDAPWISNTGPGASPYYDMGAIEYTDTGWHLADVPSFSSEWYLNGIHFTSATEGWAVGGDATQGVLLHYSGGTWTSVTPPDVGAGSEWDLDVVHFTSASNGWAVGGGNDRVVFLHYSRGKWTSIDPPADSNNWWVYAMQFTSANEGWAVGHDLTNHGGLLLHYSKGTWTSVTPPPVSSNWFLRRLHFSSATEGWAVGMDGEHNTGVLLHYSGGTWTSVPPPSLNVNWGLRGVHFSSESEGWAVGVDATNSRGLLLHYSGDTWTSVPPPAVSSQWDLWSVQFTSADEGWAMAYDNINSRGALLHYSAGAWTLVTPPFVSSDWWLEGMHFPSPTEGWAVGGDWQKGTLLHYSLWPMDFSSKLNVKGFAKDSNPTDGTCHIYSDGTFYIYEDDHGTPRYYTGTYSLAPNGKTLLFTFDSNALSAMEAMLADRLAAMGTNEGVSVQAISFVFNPVSSFKGSIQKKTNAPSTLTIKISGTVNASFDGVDRTTSFTYQSKLKYHSP